MSSAKKSSSTLYQGGSVAASKGEPKKSDVRVVDGVITEVAPGLSPSESEEVIDVSGKIIVPGMFDVHVHGREPGREDKETIETCAASAVNGGITGIVLMPNTTPAIDSGGMVQAVLDIAAKTSPIPVLTSGCITKGRLGEELAGISGMKAKGVAFLTDDGDPVPDPMVLRRAMEYADGYGLFTASHAETRELSAGGAMHEGEASYRLGIPGIPAASEECCLARDILLAAETRTHVHIQHVTTRLGMELIRRFKEEGVKVTCEVTPHHLIFCDDDILDYDTSYKMNPPLRTAKDREGLLQGLLDGVFDVIATDHAPHTAFEKNQDFVSAPFGITGLDMAVGCLFHHFIKPGIFGWDLLVERYADEPRKLIDIEPARVAEGAPADFFVFDPGATTTFTADFMESKSSNTPFLDKELDGRIDRVVLGKKVLLDR